MIPAIPRDWSLDKLHQELTRARQYEARFRSHGEDRSADYYADMAKQLEIEIAHRSKAA